MIVTLYGATGNCGDPILREILPLEFVEKVRVLLHNDKLDKKLVKRFKNKLEIYQGSVADEEIVRKTCLGSDILLNVAAVIPPLADKHHDWAFEANVNGSATIARVLPTLEKQPKLIQFSSMAVYGDRNEKHLWGEVGDPLVLAPFDYYAATKVRSEYNIIESEIKNWAVLRQTAVLYDKLMMKNISDGLMFHTTWNGPLEWCTARDTATLIKNILIREESNELDQENFWLHVFNIGGPKENRLTGFDTISEGFKIIGGSTEKFFFPNYNSVRNFHGEWFSDGYKLEELFHYQKETVREFWNHVLDTHKIFKAGKICPPCIIRKLVIDRLHKDDNAPKYWLKHHDEARVQAYLGGRENYDSIPKKWNEYNLLAKGKLSNGEDVDYEYLRSHPTRLNHFYDHDKKDKEIDISDLRKVAEAHGGKLITKEFVTGDIYRKVEWENQDGERFFARPYSVLRAGHWMNPIYKDFVWDYDRLSKKDKLFASLWYDSHKEDENLRYWFDESGNACMEEIK